jgi:hypothetical protein
LRPRILPLGEPALAFLLRTAGHCFFPSCLELAVEYTFGKTCAPVSNVAQLFDFVLIKIAD